MKRKSVIVLVSVFLIGLGMFFLPGLYVCKAAEQEIRLGMNAPLTGPVAEPGVAEQKGAMLGVEEWNAKGGIYIKEYGKKVPIKLWVEDDMAKPEVGVSVAEKLVTRNKVHMLLPSYSSSVTIAIMELAPKYGIPIMSMQSVSSEISKKVVQDPKRYWSFWKGNLGEDEYGHSFLSVYEYLIKEGLFKIKKKTWAAIVEDTDYGRANVATLNGYISKIGYKLIETMVVPIGYTDFYPQLTKVKVLNPDIVFSCFTALSSGVAFVKQYQEVGLKSSHFVILYPSRPEFIPSAGKYGNYILWAPLNFDPEGVPGHKEFAEKYNKRFNKPGNYDNADGYDKINNALDCIERAGSLEPKAMVEAISKLNRQGILGRYVFDQKNHTVKGGEGFLSFPVAQIQNGKNVMIWPRELATATYQKQPWME